MGLFSFLDSNSSSSSTSSTSTTTNTTTAGAQDGSIAAAHDVNIVDPGAIKLAGDVVSALAQVSGKSLQYYSEQNKQSLDKAVEVALEATKAPVQQLTESVFKYGTAAVVMLGLGIGAMWMFGGKKA